jgi:hypothetical protein
MRTKSEFCFREEKKWSFLKSGPGTLFPYFLVANPLDPETPATRKIGKQRAWPRFKRPFCYNPAVLLEELLDVKAKEPRQTVCNVPKDDPKDPYCGGKLKKVTELDAEAKKAAGAGKEVFRCQICKTLYVEDSPYAVKK